MLEGAVTCAGSNLAHPSECRGGLSSENQLVTSDDDELSPHTSHPNRHQHFVRDAKLKTEIAQNSDDSGAWKHRGGLSVFPSHDGTSERPAHSQPVSTSCIKGAPSPNTNTKDEQRQDTQALQHGATIAGAIQTGESPVRLEEHGAFSKGQPFSKRHRRNLAAFRISTTNIRDPAFNSQADTDKETPILSPEPISPVRQLKVKHSIPQLMKALPQLPDEAGEDTGTAQAIQDKAPIASEHTEEENAPRHDTDQPSNSASQPQSITSSRLKTQVGLRKFRLKVRGSHSSESKPHPEIPERHESKNKPAEAGMTNAQKKLKVKINRSRRDCFRSPNLKQCNSLAEIGHSSGTELASSKKVVTGRTMPRRLSDCAKDDQSRAIVVEEQSAAEEQSSPSDNLSLPKSLPQTCVIRHQVSRETNRSRASETTSHTGKGPSSSTQHGLRQKLSMLRLRSKEPQRAKLSKRNVTPVPFALRDRSRSHTNRLSSVNTTLTTIGTTRQEGRFKKLARNAKRIVRRYVKRRLD
jgi:hypothetical protein